MAASIEYQWRLSIVKVLLTLWSHDKAERFILRATFIGDDGEDLHFSGGMAKTMSKTYVSLNVTEFIAKHVNVDIVL